MQVTYFNQDTGKIIFTRDSTENFDASQELLFYPINTNYITGVYSPEDYYINNLVPTLRQSQEINISKFEIEANGVDEVVFTNLELNSEFVINRISYGTNETSTETFSTNIPGTYAIQIHKFPFLTYEVMINAN